MSLEKITQAQMDATGVCAAPDVLNGTAAENKAIFDRMVRNLMAPAYNQCVDAVNALADLEGGVKTEEAARVAAETARAAAETERETAEAERAAAEMARETAENAREIAEAARENEETGYVAQAKYWAEQAKSSAEGDMTAAVYDPQGRKTDIFTFIQPVVTTVTMLASGWSGNVYSFEQEYPAAEWNLSIEVSPTATAEQFTAFGEAMICGSAAENAATALGVAPTVDIPILIKAVAK